MRRRRCRRARVPGGAPGGGAVVVVVDDVFVEVLGPGHLRDQRSCERWAPALLEDGQLDAFDAAVAVGASGADEALAGRSKLRAMPGWTTSSGITATDGGLDGASGGVSAGRRC